MEGPTSDNISEETVSHNKQYWLSQKSSSSHRRTPSSVTANEVTSTKMKAEIQAEPEEVAIKLDKAYKSYGSRKQKLPVLVGLDMEVGKGQIYGLLGKSHLILSFLKPSQYSLSPSEQCLSNVSVLFL